MEWFTRGKLAELSEVGIEAVRFYEKKGLLPKAKRTESGYRQFDEEDVKRIRFVKRAQDLGFTLREIKEFFELTVSTRATCSDIKGKAELKIAEVEAKIKDLKRMKRSLQDIADACGDGKQAVSQCRVLDCFETGWKC